MKLRKGQRLVFGAMPVFAILLICQFCQPVAMAFSGQAGALLEGDGEILLHGINETAQLPMASTTKIMTALIALEYQDLGTICRISKHAEQVEGSSVYLKEGECYTLEQLLYGLLLRSGNDAATAIAESVAGSEERFVELMNRKARELGLENTHFDNPTGLDGETHYTTALELACITAEAMKNEAFRTIFSSKNYSLGRELGHEAVFWSNKHRLLFLRDDVIGGKTGYTKASGRSLVTVAKRGELTLIAVTLNDPDDWKDHEELLDYGFSEFERVKLSSLIAPVKIPIAGGGEITARVLEEPALTLRHGESAQLSFSYSVPRFVYKEEAALLHPIGSVEVRLNGVDMVSLPVICWEKEGVVPREGA